MSKETEPDQTPATASWRCRSRASSPAWSGLSFASCRSTACSARRPAMAACRNAPTRRPIEVLDRTIRIRFDGNVDGSLPWTFAPVQQTMDVKIGETALAFFKATNNSSAVQSAAAPFSTCRPELAGRYFTKIECFCFKQQTLAARADRRDAGDLLRRSQDRRGRGHQEHFRDHPVLHLLSQR